MLKKKLLRYIKLLVRKKKENEKSDTRNTKLHKMMNTPETEIELDKSTIQISFTKVIANYL